jgi:iron complex transport system ATP-binding protein
MALHDLHLAARYCRRLILLHQGEVIADGAPQAVLTEQNLRRVYGIEAEVAIHPTLHYPVVTPLSVAPPGR